MIKKIFTRIHKRLFCRHDNELESICNGIREEIKTLRKLIDNIPDREAGTTERIYGTPRTQKFYKFAKKM